MNVPSEINDYYESIKDIPWFHPEKFHKLITNSTYMNDVYDKNLPGDELCLIFQCCIEATSIDFRIYKDELARAREQDKKIAKKALELYMLIQERKMPSWVTIPDAYYDLDLTNLMSPGEVSLVDSVIQEGINSRQLSEKNKIAIIRALFSSLSNKNIEVNHSIKAIINNVLLTITDEDFEGTIDEYPEKGNSAKKIGSSSP